MVRATTSILAACALAACLCLSACGEAPGTQADQPGPVAQAASKQQPASQPAEPDSQPTEAANANGVETHGNLGDFEATLLDKKTAFTQEDLAKADVTVINFWSTTCGPCINEMPDIAAFSKELPANVQVVTVCLDGLYNTERAESVLQKAGYEGATIVKASGGLADLASQVQYTPTTVFVSGDGTLVGDAIVGVPKDLEQDYLAHINEVLSWMDKDPIALDNAAKQHEDAAQAQ